MLYKINFDGCVMQQLTNEEDTQKIVPLTFNYFFDKYMPLEKENYKRYQDYARKKGKDEALNNLNKKLYFSKNIDDRILWEFVNGTIFNRKYVEILQSKLISFKFNFEQKYWDCFNNIIIAFENLRNYTYIEFNYIDYVIGTNLHTMKLEEIEITTKGINYKQW